MSKRPNILFLMTDQHRFDCVGYENPVLKTPNLDALAKESVVFRQAYTSNPSCIPSRAALYTGKYPSQCACPTFITYLPDNEVTFMSRLQDAGYHTAIVGKQHFAVTNIKRGYDYEDIIDAHAPYCPATPHNSYERFIQDAGFRKESELLQWADRISHKWVTDIKYHIDYYIGEQGRKWIEEQRPDDKPWYCCVSFPGPHSPYDCLETPYAAQYDINDIPLPESKEADLRQKPPHYLVPIEGNGHGNHTLGPLSDLTDEEIRRVRVSYYANITMIDEKIGQIIKALKASGEYDNTLIAFSTDHGDWNGDFGMVCKAQYLGEALMHIPFLIKPPKMGTVPSEATKGSEDGTVPILGPPSTVATEEAETERKFGTVPSVATAESEGGTVPVFCSDFHPYNETSYVNLIDLAATFLSTADAPIPEDMVSVDLSPFWQSPDTAPRRDDMYLEAQGLRGIRTDKWKFVHYADRPYGELYDMENDPYERMNLWDNPDMGDVKASMRERLVNHLIHLGRRSQTPWNDGAPAI